MKNLVRGVIALTLVGVFVAIIYAQVRTENKLNIAKDQKAKTISSVLDAELNINSVLMEEVHYQGQDQDKDKDKKTTQVQDQNKDNPLIEKTVSSARSEEHTSELQSLRHLVC